MIFRSQLSHRLSIYPSSPWHCFFYWLDTPVDKQHSKVLLPLISCNFDNRCFPCPTQCWLFLTHKNFCLSMFAWTPMSVIDILWLGLDRALPLSLLLWSRLPSVYWCFCYNWFWRSIRTTAQVRGDMCSFENNFTSDLWDLKWIHHALLGQKSNLEWGWNCF